MHHPFRDLYARSGLDDFGLVADQIFQRPFQDEEELVLGGRNMRRRTEAWLDLHVQDRERACARIDDFGADPSEFGLLELGRDTGFHFFSSSVWSVGVSDSVISSSP